MARRASASIVGWRKRAVRRMAAVRRSTLALVARLPEREIGRPRTQDRWSVKDVLGHLMACDEETAKRFKLIGRGQADKIYWFESMADADRFNARTVARARRMRLSTVLRGMARARKEMIRHFGKLPLATLRDPSHAYTIVSWLTAPGWSHERDHVGEIKTWWRGRRAARNR